MDTAKDEKANEDEEPTNSSDTDATVAPTLPLLL